MTGFFRSPLGCGKGSRGRLDLAMIGPGRPATYPTPCGLSPAHAARPLTGGAEDQTFKNG